MTTPLNQQAPTTRFSDRANDYVKYRPTYPAEAIGAVLDGLGDSSTLVAADVGAGTGISARLLAERGVRVIAVEPNRAMREAGMRDATMGVATVTEREGGAGTTLPHGRVSYDIDWRDGTAEATGLSGASVDLVLCAQSFHWFQPDAALREFHRILKPGGRVALMWNDREDTDPATAEYGRLIREASGNHAATSHAGHYKALELSQLFTGFRVCDFRNSQPLDLAGLLGRARSASYVPKAGPAWERLEQGLAELHTRFAQRGVVDLAYAVHVYLAESS